MISCILGRRQASRRRLAKSFTPADAEHGEQIEAQTRSSSLGSQTPLIAAANQYTSICDLGFPDSLQALIQFEGYAYKEYLLGSPRTDLLLTLIRFNIFRALIENTSSIGFNSEWLEYDAISPFYRVKEIGRLGEADYPRYLRPTILQQTVEHHPWIDLFPLPQMRDNILRSGDSFDDTPLCLDLVENHQCPGQWSGLIVWTDPWDPYSWEVTEEFLKKWAWVIQDCWELFDSTNQWRVRRGERKLFPDALCMPKLRPKDSVQQREGYQV